MKGNDVDTIPRGLDALATTAVVGTDQAGGEAAAKRLLQAAAIEGSRGRAGFRPASISVRIAACPEDPKPLVRPAAAATLRRLLNDPDAALIEEWAGLAVERGGRIPDGLVPIVLEWWARQPRRDDAVFSACGARGAWLANLNPDWRKPAVGLRTPADADARWQTGTGAERAALLTTVRGEDPARGHALVRSTWKDDAADDRRRLVERLIVGLSMADEPFLEEALDDRSKTVRTAIVALLMRLPQSRYVARMTERLRAAVQVTKGLIRKSRVVAIEPPAEWSDPWERDGLEEKPPPGTGKRAWWLGQLVSRTPPAVLAEVSGLEPGEFIEASEKTDYAKVVLKGLVDAAIACADHAWCAALLASRFGHGDVEAMQLAPLWQCLPVPEREALLTEVLRHKGLKDGQGWVVLGLSAHRWSESFAKAAIKRVAKEPRPGGYGYFEESVRNIAGLLHPSQAAAFEEAVLAAAGRDPQPQVMRNIERAHFRDQMRKEFMP